MSVDFNRFAPFYDADFGEMEEDIPLYVNFAHRTGDPILELGCGTGRVLLPLARAGYRVVGVDIAAAMLARAHEKARRAGVAHRVHLVHGDARALPFADVFPLVIYAANSFMHHTHQEEQRRVLARVRDHLRPRGLLILDLFNPDVRVLAEQDGRVEFVRSWEEETGAVVSKYQAVRSFPARQLLEVTYIYERVFPDGRVQRTVAPFAMRYLWPEEIPLLLELVGLEVEAMYGTYDLDPISDDSPRLIVVARRGVAPE